LGEKVLGRKYFEEEIGVVEEEEVDHLGRG
jgi:hypothetical protein